MAKGVISNIHMALETGKCPDFKYIHVLYHGPISRIGKCICKVFGIDVLSRCLA